MMAAINQKKGFFIFFILKHSFQNRRLHHFAFERNKIHIGIPSLYFYIIIILLYSMFHVNHFINKMVCFFYFFI